MSCSSASRTLLRAINLASRQPIRSFKSQPIRPLSSSSCSTTSTYRATNTNQVALRAPQPNLTALYRHLGGLASSSPLSSRTATVSRNGYRNTTVVQALLQYLPQLNLSSAAGNAKPDMFCFQCEQTQNHTGCTVVGNCGKTPDVAALQDHLVHVLKGLGFWVTKAKDAGVAISHDCDIFTVDALFSTMTNVNFDRDRFKTYINDAVKYRDQYRQLYQEKQGKGADAGNDIANYTPPNLQSVDALSEQGRNFGVLERKQKLGDDISGVQELIVYGLKGTAAYQSHASELGQDVPFTFDHIYRALGFLSDAKESGDLGKLVGMALKTGEANLHTMQALDAGHTTRYGNPEPTPIRISAKKGKCILVSGHDIWMLEDLLKQTQGKNINVYTHGELLPAHTYPLLKKYKHLVGNYGGPWQLQKMEFSRFPGPIVVTTNCLIEPRDSYKDRLFTMGQVGWSGIRHLRSNDFSEVIKKAEQSEGFAADEPEKTIMGGFGRSTILSVADKVLGAVQAGALKRIFLIGGCDGSEGERSYYRDLAVALPKDTAILTLGCGKYRFNKLDLGTLPGLNIPRVLDMGQCNDAYGAIAVAGALAKALNTDVNKLPISYAISWFEQKAVAVFLTMLHLGIKNIRVGPALPAFVSPNVLKFLVEKFDLKAADVKNVQGDLKDMMSGK